MECPRQPHVFGPVPSRRLGRSLGVDLVPYKVCSYDCIYCQLGRTTCRTIERKEWVPTDAVLEELEHKLACRPDYITLSGSGEPTLHSRLGDIIGRIRALTPIPVAVLTNGSLLWLPEVREQVALADVVLPSLDAPDPERFEFINRPHPDITFARLLEGLIAFRRAFAGQFWLEVMVLNGYTTLPAQMRQLAERARQIHPDKVQLNTAVRPPTEVYAEAVPAERLRKLARIFEPEAEVVAGCHARLTGSESPGSAEALLGLLRRRPCTEADLACGLRMRVVEVAKHLAVLEAAREVMHRRHGELVFYQLSGESRRTAAPSEKGRTAGYRRSRRVSNRRLPRPATRQPPRRSRGL